VWHWLEAIRDHDETREHDDDMRTGGIVMMAILSRLALQEFSWFSSAELLRCWEIWDRPKWMYASLIAYFLGSPFFVVVVVEAADQSRRS